MLKYFKNKFGDNFLLIWTYTIIVIGLLALFSASKSVTSKESFFLKQLIWVLLGSGLISFLRDIDYRDIKKFSPLLYLLGLFFLFFVLFFGKGAGATRWIRMGWFHFQPSEFAKLIVVISLSSYFSEKNVKRFSVLLAGLLILSIPFLCILKQPDLGTTFIFIIVFFAIFYQAGGRKIHMFLMIATGVLMSPIFWLFMKEYQKERILMFLNPMRDPLGKGYNLIQSIITIGSGRMLGKGYLKGTQSKLAFLPEYHTDFIFCVLAEEFGLIGVIVVLLLYYMLFKAILDIIYSTQDSFGRLLGTGILSMFASHVFIDIGMTLGLFPVVGLPLPFISYGGSSLIVFLISVMLLVSIKENSLMF
jgi:rod shape determining protein RodA